MYIVKSAGIRSYPHLFQKHHFFYRLHVEIQIRLWRGALKSQRLGFFFSPREKITLLKFEISKLTKRNKNNCIV